MLSVEATARVIRALYFLIIVSVAVFATAARYDGDWGAVVAFAVVDLFLIVPVVIDGALWDRETAPQNQLQQQDNQPPGES